MPNYIQDPNDPKKQVPGPQPDQYFDRVSSPQTCSFHKTPNHVLISSDVVAVGFFFGTSASFAAKRVADGYDADGGSTAAQAAHLSSSVHYNRLGAISAGTILNINPTAWSGSAADAGKVVFIYKGGLDGSPWR